MTVAPGDTSQNFVGLCPPERINPACKPVRMGFKPKYEIAALRSRRQHTEKMVWLLSLRGALRHSSG